jgi:hypothetical protein
MFRHDPGRRDEPSVQVSIKWTVAVLLTLIVSTVPFRAHIQSEESTIRCRIGWVAEDFGYFLAKLGNVPTLRIENILIPAPTVNEKSSSFGLDINHLLSWNPHASRWQLGFRANQQWDILSLRLGNVFIPLISKERIGGRAFGIFVQLTAYVHRQVARGCGAAVLPTGT